VGFSSAGGVPASAQEVMPRTVKRRCDWCWTGRGDEGGQDQAVNRARSRWRWVEEGEAFKIIDYS